MLTTYEEMNEIPIDKKMKLNIVVPQEGIRIVMVTTNSKIQIIDNIFPKEKVYIYNGAILEKSMNLMFYNIKHDDCIVAFDKELVKQQVNKGSELERWFQASRDSEKMNSRVYKAVDNSIRVECARLCDLKQNKLEMRRPLRRIFNSIPIDRKIEKIPTKIPGKLKFPVSEPLPSFW